MILSPKGFGLDLHLTPYCFRQPLIELISSQVITIYHAAYLNVYEVLLTILILLSVHQQKLHKLKCPQSNIMQQTQIQQSRR